MLAVQLFSYHSVQPLQAGYFQLKSSDEVLLQVTPLQSDVQPRPRISRSPFQLAGLATAPIFENETCEMFLFVLTVFVNFC